MQQYHKICFQGTMVCFPAIIIKGTVTGKPLENKSIKLYWVNISKNERSTGYYFESTRIVSAIRKGIGKEAFSLDEQSVLKKRIGIRLEKVFI